MAQPENDGLDVFKGLLNVADYPVAAHGVGKEMLASLANGLSIHSDWKSDAEFRAFIVLANATLGLRQSDLARHLMISKMTLQRWLNGEYLPRPDARESVVEDLIEIAYFMIDEISKLSEPEISAENSSQSDAADTSETPKDETSDDASADTTGTADVDNIVDAGMGDGTVTELDAPQTTASASG